MKEIKEVQIITLNYNQNDFTLKCINSVLNSDYLLFKILLIDNGSTSENFQKLVDNLPTDNRLIVYRIDNNIGYVNGVNFGLEKGIQLDYDYFVIMNNDTIIDRKSISELVKTANKYQQKVIVTGKVYHYDEPNKLQDIGYTYKNKNKLLFNRIGLDEIDNGQYDEEKERDMLDDVFWLLPAKLYKEIGGYSPYFWFNAEQADFALRAKKVGYKLIYTPNAKLWHKGSVSIGGRERNPRLAYWHIQSTLIFRFRHLSAYNFLLQYIEIFIGIVSTYYKTVVNRIKGNKEKFDYANAKIKGFIYFNKWVFTRNINKGENPFAKH